PRWLAPSISSTSSETPAAISTHDVHTPQGSEREVLEPSRPPAADAVGARASPLRSQLSAFASSRAVVVFPTPRAPVNRNAWATRPDSSAAVSTDVTCAWPTRSAKTWGRYLSVSARCDMGEWGDGDRDRRH